MSASVGNVPIDGTTSGAKNQRSFQEVIIGKGKQLFRPTFNENPLLNFLNAMNFFIGGLEKTIVAPLW